MLDHSPVSLGQSGCPLSVPIHRTAFGSSPPNADTLPIRRDFKASTLAAKASLQL